MVLLLGWRGSSRVLLLRLRHTLQYFDRPGKAYHPGDLYLPNLPYLTLLEGPMIMDIGLPITRDH